MNSRGRTDNKSIQKRHLKYFQATFLNLFDSKSLDSGPLKKERTTSKPRNIWFIRKLSLATSSVNLKH